jgi:hypothetical protein
MENTVLRHLFWSWYYMVAISQFHAPGCFNRWERAHLISDKVVPRVGVDKRRIACPCWELNLDCPLSSLSLYRLSSLVFKKSKTNGGKCNLPLVPYWNMVVNDLRAGWQHWHAWSRDFHLIEVNYVHCCFVELVFSKPRQVYCNSFLCYRRSLFCYTFYRCYKL